jgi:hypothetical protein
MRLKFEGVFYSKKYVIKMNFIEKGWQSVDWTHLAEDRE